MNKTEEAKSYESLIFETLSGDLIVKQAPQTENDTNNLFLQMNFPLNHPQKQHLEKRTIDELLQSLSVDSLSSVLDIQFCEKTKDLLLVIDTVDTVLNIKPSIEDLMKVRILIC